MKTTDKKTFRQGDVLLCQVEEIPLDAIVAEKKDSQGNARIVLAYGEVTGHAHAIHDLDKVDVFVNGDGTMYIDVREPAGLQHEEHGRIELPAGRYQRVIQREYSPEDVRNVAD